MQVTTRVLASVAPKGGDREYGFYHWRVTHGVNRAPVSPSRAISQVPCTEVQGITGSCVASAGGVGSKPRLWNLQN